MALFVLMLTTTLLLMLRKNGLLFGPIRLVPVDVSNVVAASPNSSGLPTPLSDPLIAANMNTYEPHFPYSDFFEAREYAKGACFQLMVKEKLPEGSYSISVSNTLGTVVLPLEKQAPDLYVSTPLLILQSHSNTTYFFGYGILLQEAGTRDTLNIQVERAVPGWK